MRLHDLRHLHATLALVILATSALALPASAAGTVGPKRYFTGVINGHDGNTAIPITITPDHHQDGLFRPVRPGQKDGPDPRRS